jgi:hypothetical protein
MISDYNIRVVAESIFHLWVVLPDQRWAIPTSLGWAIVQGGLFSIEDWPRLKFEIEGIYKYWQANRGEVTYIQEQEKTHESQD